MKRQIVQAAVGTGIATALGVGLAVSPAQAAPVLGKTKFCSYGFAQAGTTCFYSDGDKLAVHDNWKDGYRSVSKWHVYDRKNNNKIVRKGQCVNKSGANTTKWCNYNLPDGRYGGTSRYIIIFNTFGTTASGKVIYNDSNAVIGYTSGK
ncbi:hypothetical protein [Streptomyces sp. NRRL F-5135]|uniref:hypothetical protein n=1 Tax=Streptomyces sp. NRRL F-5135 TaxID=1463858 RepID=UPI0004C8D1A1|nr:hypothetical protein [Streptomyces sp. NRRL F-5135]